MLETIIETLIIMGWLGIVLIILAFVNILTGTLVNIWSGKEKFNGKKMAQGITKVIAFYVCAVFVAVAASLLPSINTMITNAFQVQLLTDELLNTFSSIAVLGVVISTIVVHAKKAIIGIGELATLSSKTNDGEEKVDE